MSPEETQAAADALISATQQNAQAAGQNIESQAAQLAPGLATGTNAPGGYNYVRIMDPVVQAITPNYTTLAKQAVFRQALKDAAYQSQEAYTAANVAYQDRYREWQRQQAIEADRRRRQAEAAARAAAASAARSSTPTTGTKGNTVSGVRVNANPVFSAWDSSGIGSAVNNAGRVIQNAVSGGIQSGGGSRLIQNGGGSNLIQAGATAGNLRR